MSGHSKVRITETDKAVYRTTITHRKEYDMITSVKLHNRRQNQSQNSMVSEGDTLSPETEVVYP